MKKSTLILAGGLALVFAIIASFMIFTYLKNRPAQASEQHVPVVVASHDLTFGSTLESEMMKVVPYPKASLPKGYYGVPDSLLGQVTKVFLMENEPILASKLSSTGGGLSLMIQNNMRAASIQVDKVSGVSGFVLPGDRVDVIASIEKRDGGRDEAVATTVLQNIEVLAAGEKTQQQGDKIIQVQSVTLLVDAAGAQTLALVSREAKLQLALRNPTDTDTLTLASVSKSEIIAGKKKEEKPKVVYVKSKSKVDTKKEETKKVDNTVTVFKGGNSKTQTPPLGPADTASNKSTSK
jgi:pilus assembly protein CpaB